jgi:hypothetical protein
MRRLGPAFTASRGLSEHEDYADNPREAGGNYNENWGVPVSSVLGMLSPAFLKNSSTKMAVMLYLSRTFCVCYLCGTSRSQSDREASLGILLRADKLFYCLWKEIGRREEIRHSSI